MSDDDLIVRHAEHFLSRLDRLNTREVDVALALYRDPELLRAVLQRVSLPEAAERVAVSLGDPVNGPFIVVTRDGHFVTCLGALRERMAEAARLTGGSNRACGQLLSRILRNPAAVSREEFLAVSAWEPMLAPVFMDLYLAMTADMPLVAPELRRLRSTTGRAGEALHRYWNLVHAASHLALLATMGGENEHYRALTDRFPAARAAFSFPLTNTGVVRFIVVGAWSVGRLGKQLLPAYKKALGDDVALFDLFDTVFALVAIGRRTSRLRAEIAKALSAAPNTARTPGAVALRAAMRRELELVCDFASSMLDEDAQALDDWLVKFGTGMLCVDGRPSPPDLPAEVARAAALSLYADGLTEGRGTICSLNLIAAASRGPPEQFYLERALNELVRTPWEPRHTELLLAPHRKVDQVKNKPATRVASPGPNQPCTCGSGRKYKKCCGNPAGGDGSGRAS